MPCTNCSLHLSLALCHVHAVCCCSTTALQESPVANRIKEAFFSERGLAGNVHRLPFDKLFAIESVKKVIEATLSFCRESVMSPETGNIHSGTGYISTQANIFM